MKLQMDKELSSLKRKIGYRKFWIDVSLLWIQIKIALIRITFDLYNKIKS